MASPAADAGRSPLLELGRLNQVPLCAEPYRWAFIDKLFSPINAARLAETFPKDKVKKVAGSDGEKGYQYFTRSLVQMGASQASNPEGLSDVWTGLTRDLLSPAYRQTISRITGLDLSDALLEVNVFHYGPDCWLGPHLDLKEKLVTHVLYFNQAWNRDYGGYLKVLGSSDMDDVVAECLPLAGNSALLVRSDNSWHAVARIAEGVQLTRRSINVVFKAPGSVNSMFPSGQSQELSDYPEQATRRSLLAGLLGRFRRWPTTRAARPSGRSRSLWPFVPK